MPTLDLCVLLPATCEPGPLNRQVNPRYRGAVTATANQVAAALREHLPASSGPRLHRLLYYVQGHHIALFGRPAFTEPLMAGPDGPTVDGLTEPPAYQAGSVTDSIHTAATVVAGRYGGLTTADLDRLTTAEPPWRLAAADRAEIAHQALREFFTGPGRQEGAERFTAEYLRQAQKEVIQAWANRTTQPDDLDAILAKVRGRDRR